MARQERAFLALVFLSLFLLTAGAWWNSDTAREYREDLEYYNRKCTAERQSKEGEYKKDCQRVLYRTLDDPVAFLTGGLVLATIALFGATLLLYVVAVRQGTDAKDAAKAARDSADAARQSADAAILALEKGESPDLHPTFRLTGIEADPHLSPDTWAKVIQCEFTNYGKSPAIITSVDLQIVEPNMFRDLYVNLETRKLGEHAAVADVGSK